MCSFLARFSQTKTKSDRLKGHLETKDNINFSAKQNFNKKNEPPHDKTNKVACAPSEDSDMPGHPPSLIRVFACAQWLAKDPSFLHADSKDSDQTGRMPRLI